MLISSAHLPKQRDGKAPTSCILVIHVIQVEVSFVYLAGYGESFLGRAGEILGVDCGEDCAFLGGRRRLGEGVKLT